MKTIGDKMGDLMEEVDYHLLWYKWFSKYPPNKEINHYNKMTKSQQIEFLQNKEKENGR